VSILIGLAHEPVFNAAMTTQVVFQQLANGCREILALWSQACLFVQFFCIPKRWRSRKENFTRRAQLYRLAGLMQSVSSPDLIRGAGTESIAAEAAPTGQVDICRSGWAALRAVA